MLEKINDAGVRPATMLRTLTDVDRELERARQKHRGFPRDPIHGVAIIQEETGEAMRAAIQATHEGGSYDAIEHELIQSAAMCLRMLYAYRAAGVFGAPAAEQESDETPPEPHPTDSGRAQ